MAGQQTSPALESDSNVRKRVCKACDRCRLKKSKCDGNTPCSRCRSDNAICVFGERKKSHYKIYPKGYVEMLEHQQTQLISGLQELYKRSANGQGWDGPMLNDAGGGKPLIHDILDRLGVLQLDPQANFGNFEEDPEAMQQRLASDGAGLDQRRDSYQSECERDPSHASFFESSPQRSSFLISQLPTPPMHSPGIDLSLNNSPQPSGLPLHKVIQVRPQSLQIHPGYTSWDGGMNPAILQTQNWMDSPTPYDTNMAYLQSNGYPEFPAAENNAEMVDWNQEMFDAYLSSPVA